MRDEPALLDDVAAAPVELPGLPDQLLGQVVAAGRERDEGGLEADPLGPPQVAGRADQGTQLVGDLGQGDDLAEVGDRGLPRVQGVDEGPRVGRGPRGAAAWAARRAASAKSSRNRREP